MSDSLYYKNPKLFWKEVRKVKINKMLLGMKIYGECHLNCIIEKFSDKFRKIYDDYKCQDVKYLMYNLLKKDVRKGEIVVI